MDENNEIIGTMGQPLSEKPTTELYLNLDELSLLEVACQDSMEKAYNVLMAIREQDSTNPIYEEASKENKVEELESFATAIVNYLPGIMTEIAEAIQTLSEPEEEPKTKIILP